MADAIPRDRMDRMANVFRLLGDPTRLAILSHLMTEGEQNVGEVATATGRTAANVSKHLKLLSDGGMLIRRKQGLQVYYHLSSTLWERLCRLVSTDLLRRRE
jgi:DNA-binding transcriptional ArsR family regulator